jgi:perosamine synthetase
LNIPFYQPSIGPEEIAEVVDTLKSGWLTTGPKTRQFEQEFAAFTAQKHAVAVTSCTAALHLALEAAGVRPGDWVVVPTLTFAATAEVVRYLGGHPLFCDCRDEDFNLDVSDAERRVREALGTGQRVRAIVPVHYGGQVGDVQGVHELARRYGLRTIEDAAHCCPAYYREDRDSNSSAEGWKPVGTEAEISCYSFYANKPITTGEGGMACTNDENFAQRMRLMSLHGLSRDAWNRYSSGGSWRYEILAPGFKYNFTDIAAAIGLHQLRKAHHLHRRRTQLADRYCQALSSVDEVRLPSVQPNRIHSWHLFVVRLRLDRLKIDRAQFIQELKGRGISASVHWMPLHLHPYYRDTYGSTSLDFPVAGSIYPEIVTLPLYPDMTEESVDHVCRAIKEVVARYQRSHPRPLGATAANAHGSCITRRKKGGWTSPAPAWD